MAMYKWNWLIYMMVSDDELERRAREDLSEMQRVGSTPDVNVVVLRIGRDRPPQCLNILQGEAREDVEQSREIESLGPRDDMRLRRFVEWACSRYEAMRCFVEVWGYGEGWRSRGIVLGKAPDPAGVSRPGERSRAEGLRRAPRGEGHAVRVGELKRLADAIVGGLRDNERSSLTGRQPDTLVGYDACYMNMLELAYQMKDAASYMIGSETTVPLSGWPYQAILGALVHDPDMGPGRFAEVVVDEYRKAYELRVDNTSPLFTISALDLSRVPRVAQRLDALVEALMPRVGTLRDQIGDARGQSLSMASFHDYFDLGDFCDRLRRALATGGEEDQILAATGALRDELTSPREDGLIFRHWTTRSRYCGVSFYFPWTGSDLGDQDYRALAYSKQGQWLKLLDVLARQ